jgi:hypothetical protein
MIDEANAKKVGVGGKYFAKTVPLRDNKARIKEIRIIIPVIQL